MVLNTQYCNVHAFKTEPIAMKSENIDKNAYWYKFLYAG